MKALAIILTVIAAAGGALYYLKTFDKPSLPVGAAEPITFEECAKYFPVQESYPRRCTNGAGVTLTEDIGNAAQLHETIVVSAPRPADIITSPLRIKGQAQSDWFAEGALPIEVRSATGELVGRGEGTTRVYTVSPRLLTFEGTATFDVPLYGASGTVLIYNANKPSVWLTIPIRFK